jgi:hypothetical protein
VTAGRAAVVPRRRTARRPVAGLAALLGTGALAMAAGGCTLLQGKPHGTVLVGAPAQPSALVVVLDRRSASARFEFGKLVPATVRAGEHILVIDSASGERLGTFQAPVFPRLRVPAPPAPLSSGPTSYERAKHGKAMTAWRASVAQDASKARTAQRQRLAAWASAIVSKVAGPDEFGQFTPDHGIAPRLRDAAADFSSFTQANVQLGSRRVLAILGLGSHHWTSVPNLPALLRQVTVIVSGFPPRPGVQNSFRKQMLSDGAAKVVVLTPATGGALPSVVAEGLAGATVQTTASQP